MSDLDYASVNEQLAKLQEEFHQKLPATIDEIKQQWKQLIQQTASYEGVASLHVIVHGLTGASGTFCAMAVSSVSAELEALLKTLMIDNPVLDDVVQQKVELLFVKLEQSAESWRPTAIPFVPPARDDQENSQGGEIICLVEDDPLVARDISVYLEKEDYQVQHFSSIDEFKETCTEIRPDALLMDMVFEDGELGGADAIKELESYLEGCPVIFISNRDDVQARLAATRVGAMRYFTKPLDMDKLVQTLDSLFSRQPDDPYRILLVDDDKVLLNYFSIILRKAGVKVRALNDPLDSLKALEQFRPDLILLDVYMPGCSGIELAQVIRQDDKWAQVPIVFLSTEPDLDRQLLALNLGGDDFLNKSVEPRHLLKAIMARAKRSRWASAMYKNLQDTLRDSEYKNITLNQHAIVSIADVKGNITYANDKFCEISEYSEAELIGQNHRLLKSNLHPADFFEEMWALIIRGDVWHGCICNRSKTGREYWVESTIVPFLDECGKPYQYVAIRTDVTQMRANEDRLNRSQAFANIGTWDWNIKTGELYWSERIAPLFGYEPGELEHTYDNFLNSVHPGDRQRLIDAIDACIYQGEKYDVEHRVVWPDGTVHWVHERGDVVRDEYGEPAHMLGVVQDITPRKEAQQALLESSQRLREAQEMGHIGHWSWHVNSGKIHWSDEIYRIFGYQPGEFDPDYDRFMAMLHPDDVERVKASEAAASAKGEKHSIDHRIVLSDGEVRWVHEEAEPVKNSAGEMIALHGTVQDISDRIWGEQLQKANNHILELIAKDQPLKDILMAIALHAEEMLPGVIVTIMLLDESGYHLRQGAAPNLPEFYKKSLDGIEIGDSVGLCCASAYNGEPLIAEDLSTHPNWKDYREITSKAGLAACWSLPILASNGSVLGTCDMYYKKVKSPDDQSMKLVTEIANFASIAIEQKRSVKALMDAMQDAESANRAKSQFLSSMSHELRTPMNAIIGFAQLLQMDADDLNELQHDNVNEIVHAGNHLLTLINEVLDLSKIEAGHINLYIESVLVSNVMDECLSMLMPLADKRGIEIQLMCDGEHISFGDLCQKNMEVQADHTRLKQVLFNLLSNAVKYNKANGQIIISCSPVDAAYVRISIKDTGPGIELEKQVQLFKVFSRLGAEYTEVEGTGMGLAITKNIVEMMGGNIGVDSKPGEGSTFWIELLSNQKSEVHNKDVSVAIEKTLSSDKKAEHEYTLLYIEDNPANLRLVKQVLGRRPNIRILSAEEPMLGLELALEHKPDIILLDINLPGIDGFGVLKHLRDRKENCDTPVIAVSANAMPSDIEKGLNAGFDHYVTKPMDVIGLLSVIDEVVQSL